MSDEPGVMGNLPRSRPGRRSAKRGGAGEGPKRAAEVKPAKPKTTRAKAAPKPAASAKAKRTTGGMKAKAGASGSARAGSAKGAGGATAKAGPTRTTPGGRTKPTRARVGGPKAATPSAGLEADTAPETAVRDERVETAPGSDPITSALRLGMAIGDAGLKAVAKIVERLPRP